MTYSDRDRVIEWLDAGHGEKLTVLDRAVLIAIAHNVFSDTRVYQRGIDYLARQWGVIPKSVDRSITRLHPGSASSQVTALPALRQNGHPGPGPTPIDVFGTPGMTVTRAIDIFMTTWGGGRDG